MFGEHPQAVKAAPDLRRRIIAYFRSLGYRDPEQLRRLADSFASALSAEVATPDAAVAEVRRSVASVFRAGLGMAELSDDRAEALGRAAFVTIGGAARWPGLFLSRGEAAPASFAGALAAAIPVAVPTECPGTMPEQSLDPFVKDWARAFGIEPKRHPA